eukprot:Em0001g3574a
MDDEATHPVDDSHDTISVVNSEDEESALSSGSGQTSSGWSGNNDAGSSNAKKRKAEGDEGQRTTLSVSDAEEMVQQLKEKFRSATTRSERIKILTVLPKSWSKRKIAKEFGVSRYLARRAKKLVAEKGILSGPNPKGGRALPVEIEEEVHTFFWSDSISHTMPGKKDFLSVKGADGKRVHRQKRLVLCNLKEAYREFKLCHPDMKIGFTKFSLLRPKECVLAGASGTHSVCVCTIHQNTKLMMVGSKLEILTGGKFKHYRHCLAAMQCNPPNVGCYFGECELCPGTEPLHTCLQDAMDRNDVDAVEFQQWTTTDRATLETKVLSVNEFLDTFVTMVKKLLVHDFVAKQQTAFMQKTKESLKEGEFLVIADFSENYSFVVQDEVQSLHWNNGSATIHPFVCYYVAEGTLNTLCYVVISECNQHDTIAVHLFQRKLLDFVTRECGGKRPQKVYYMSDGCAAQYKNCKNFTNLCYHLVDFGVRAEWHFFATSHGKSAGDGAGGTLKRVACRASLQRPYQDQILTARQLYEFAITEIKGMDFTFASQEEHDREASLLEERLKASRTVPGTQKLHSFVPLSNNTVEVKSFSLKRVLVNFQQEIQSGRLSEWTGTKWSMSTLAIVALGPSNAHTDATSLIEVLLNHYSSANAECEEKLTMLHMETSNTIQDEQDESKSQRLQHRLELVQELALQNIAVHRQKLAAAQRKKLIAAKIIQEDNPPDPKGLAPPEKKEEDSKILSLLQELSNRLSRLEGAENKPSPKQHRERCLDWRLREDELRNVFHYLDDFVVLGTPSTFECQSALEKLRFRRSDLLAAHKCKGPSTCVTFLGIVIDTATRELRLPPEKLVHLCSLLSEWGNRKACSRRELESLIGYLNHASSDASGSWGCGAWHGTLWFQWRWGPLSGQQPIAAKEFIPILIAALVWGRSWSGQKVLCHCNNQVVVAAIRSRSSAQTQIMHLLRCLFFIKASSNFSPAAEYITSAENAIADALSRDNLNSFQMVPGASRGPAPIHPQTVEVLLDPAAKSTSPAWMQQFRAISITTSPPLLTEFTTWL